MFYTFVQMTVAILCVLLKWTRKRLIQSWNGISFVFCAADDFSIWNAFTWTVKSETVKNAFMRNDFSSNKYIIINVRQLKKKNWYFTTVFDIIRNHSNRNKFRILNGIGDCIMIFHFKVTSSVKHCKHTSFIHFNCYFT